MEKNVWMKLAVLSLAGIVLSFTLLWGIGQFNNMVSYNRYGYGMNNMPMNMNGMYNGNMNMNNMPMNMNMNGSMNMQGGMGMMGGGMMMDMMGGMM